MRWFVVGLGSGCNLASNAGLPSSPDRPGGDHADADADTDADADSDADADTDADTDTATGPTDTGGPCGSDGELVLSEVLDFGNLKFVELFNAGDGPVHLDDHTIEVYFNGSTGGASVVNLPDEVLPKCTAYTVAYLRPDYVDAYGGPPDLVDDAIRGNGNDAYQLLGPDGVIDVYGEKGVDGLSEDWNYEDASARRVPSVRTGRKVWAVDQWSIESWTTATPGIR
ncbi:MAG: hypothetical protein ABMB14_02675 [Myxococcota bacterium]